jgi:hypothetical protein
MTAVAPRRLNWLKRYYYEDLEYLYNFWRTDSCWHCGDLPTEIPAPYSDRFRSVLLLNTICYLENIPQFFRHLHTITQPDSRVLVTFYNPSWEPILRFASWLGLRDDRSTVNWLDCGDITNLLNLSGFEVIYHQKRLLLPIWIPLLSWLVNNFLAKVPIINEMCLTEYVIARPLPLQVKEMSCSVIIPARNEEGNIEDCLRRLPKLGTFTEVIFVEGHSQDDTWQKILAVKDNFPQIDQVVCLQQLGVGKGDAVRLGFSKAIGEVLVILDADLTVPPEDLTLFFEAIASGYCELANGCRLIYPISYQSMPWLNQFANHSFARLLRWLLRIPIKDSLCGTKAISRQNYTAISTSQAKLGEFDPFGDYELLFGSARLGLKVRDIPVRYLPRTYGKSNIHHVRDGLRLLHICWQYFRRGVVAL